jgi:exosortase/archaeosortase family protein
MRTKTQKLWFFSGLILLLAGLVVAITPTYMPKVIGLVLMFIGLGILVLTAKLEKTPQEKEEREEIVSHEIISERKNLAKKLISTLTFNGKITPFFPALGVILILFVYAFNILFREGFELGVNDTIAILLGVTLIFYNYVPSKFKKERDFVFLFFIFMFVILVLPITIYNIFAGPIPESPNSPFIFWLLAQPTSDFLNFIGITSSAYSASNGVFIDYKILGDIEGQGGFSTVGIGLSCTGLYSVSIFISGFFAFILLEYGRFDIRVASLLTLGVFTSWFANILRMSIIVIVGSYHGKEALLWTHENLGIFIFMLWVGLFWALMFKLLVPKEGSKDESRGNGNKSREDQNITDSVESSGSQNP